MRKTEKGIRNYIVGGGFLKLARKDNMLLMEIQKMICVEMQSWLRDFSYQETCWNSQPAMKPSACKLMKFFEKLTKSPER